MIATEGMTTMNDDHWDDPNPTTICSKHGEVEYTDQVQTFTGYAGGQCSTIRLACGCWDMDESADVRAAE